MLCSPKKIPTFSFLKTFFLKENVILVGNWKVELDFRVLAPISIYEINLTLLETMSLEWANMYFLQKA